ncbi:MAG: TonB-dependent receptor, partial [Betaproteobacteria bacterium]
GFEYVHEESHRWTNSSSLVNPATTVGNPNPNPALPAGFDGSFARTADNYYTARTLGAYAQDIIDLTSQWKLVAGARFDDFKADYDRPAPAGPLSRTDRVWSTRAGVLFQPTDEITYYASYGTSFNPSAELYQLDDRATNTPPEKSRNYEIGIKWELLEGDLSARTALFRSEKTNERNTDLAVSVEENLLSGKRHTDGIELEATGRLSERWQVFGAVALMRAKIDAATGQQADTLGRIPLNTPKYTYALWTTYALGGGWKIGGGFDGAGLRYGQNANTNAAPAYTRWDALIEYEQKAYSIKLNALNLFDRDYYEGVYAGHVLPGVKRSLQLTLLAKF